MLPRFLRSALDSAPSLPSSSLRHLFPCLSYYLSFSLCFILCHSSSLPSYLVLSTFLTLSFSLFHFSLFISVPLSRSLSLFLSLSAIYLSLSFYTPHCRYHASLSRARSLLFISVALMILLRVGDSANRHCLLPYDRFRSRSCFSKISKVSAKYNERSQVARNSSPFDIST